MGELAVILKVIDYLLLGVAMTPVIRAELQQLSGELETFVREGRNPTEAEWQQINHRLNNRIMALKADYERHMAAVSD